MNFLKVMPDSIFNYFQPKQTPQLEEKKPLSNKEIVTVYFSGTAHHINEKENLGGLLYANTRGDVQHRFGFSGCGVTHGLSGALFGAGLYDQCEQAKNAISKLISSGKKIQLNCYGHSRGAIAALLLAKLLGNYSADLLTINLVLFDPVPGNFLLTSKLDFFNITLTKQALDVSACHNLINVLALYTNEPLPSIAAHAPLFPNYPQGTCVIEEVLPGCHSGAQRQICRGDKIQFINHYSYITFSRVTDFLQKLGTQFDFGKLSFYCAGEQIDLLNKELINEFLARYKYTLSNRETHSLRSVKIITNENKLLIHPPLPVTPNIPEIDNLRLAELFKEFLAQLFSAMSKHSKASTKGHLLVDFYNSINLESLRDRTVLINAFRNVLALVLQRDRDKFSFFTTTTTGEAAKNLLRSKEFKPLAKIILGTASHEIRYRDLRMFVLGDNNKDYFTANSKQTLYKLLSENTIAADNSYAYLNSPKI